MKSPGRSSPEAATFAPDYAHPLTKKTMHFYPGGFDAF